MTLATHDKTDDTTMLTDESASPDTHPEPVEATPSATARWGALAVLAAVLLASLGVLTWRFVDTRAAGGSESLGAQRDAVMSQATKFAIRLNTYGPDQLGPDHKTMPTYRKEVAALLTPKFQTDFDKNVPLAEATVAGQGAGRSAQVYAAGVAAIDQDTATALVTGTITFTYPQKQGSAKRVTVGQEPFRWEVDLVKTHGTWLVDNWTPAEQAPATSGSGASR